MISIIGGPLQDTFLANPYVSVVLLVLLLLLIATVSIISFMLCYYVRQNYINQRYTSNLKFVVVVVTKRFSRRAPEQALGGIQKSMCFYRVIIIMQNYCWQN